MKSTIIFIHGMFQNARSWDNWVNYFTGKGYDCITESWPLHEGDPASLRANPPAGLGKLGLATVTEKYRQIAASLPEKPIIIGHSVGGLITQILVNEGLAKMGIAISPVAPNAMITFDWGFIKNSAMITNPFKGDDMFTMDLEGFHDSFCNTMSLDETREAYERTATHDSRNVLRDCLGEDGNVDLDIVHAPMLLIAGKEDQIIPYELTEKNANAYTDEASITDYLVFDNRGHFICGEPGWEEVIEAVDNWIQQIQTRPNYKPEPAEVHHH